MPGFKTLKLAAQAMSPASLKRANDMRKMFQAGGPTPEQRAQMTPEELAAYEHYEQAVTQAQANMQEQVAGARAQQELDRPLLGPAGREVYGAMADEQTTGDLGLDAINTFKDMLKNPLANQQRPGTGKGESLPLGPEREAVAAAERAARDAARAPYRAPVQHPIGVVRIATRAKTQLGEVAQFLGQAGFTAHPELVYGISRVPDHLGGGLKRDKNRVVEYDVFHAATQQLPPSAPATAGYFHGREQWCSRRVGEPSVLDEDLAIDYLHTAGIGPERTLGIVRELSVYQAGGGDESGGSYTIAEVNGVHAFHPDGQGGPPVLDALKARRPLSGSPVPGTHVEVLNWGTIRQAVHPESHKRVPYPSPFGYLPSTPGELIQMYLEVVGVGPADCYATQVTRDSAGDINGVSEGKYFTTTTNWGEKLPAADGGVHPRLSGGTLCVIAYRDSPDHAAGRERWAAYQRDVLQANLHLRTGVRRPVEQLDLVERLPLPLRGMWKTAEFVADFVDGDGDDAFADIPPHRYCWPPSK